ncbi:MAG: hypothetical protein QG599_2291 [Pseudomonadota bacterium]|nr:hypothetical protein [Pseudomonadota bacterium]
MNQAIKKLIDITTAEIGTHESARNNTGPKIEEYQRATWLEPAAWPWCAAFTCWIMREWLKDEPVRNDVKSCFKRSTLTLAEAEKVRCQDASAFGWEKWAKKHEIAVLQETELAKAGDFVVFDFSHIGLVIEDQTSLHSKIITIEGNTNKKGTRDSISNDGVWRKEREPNLTKSYIRLFSK